MTLEDTLMDDIRNKREIDIERALLIASGCDTEEKVSEYKAKLDELDIQFEEYLLMQRINGREINTEEETLQALDEFLWDGNPERYNHNVYLTDVVDAQMSKAGGVGNCKGLSSILGVLGTRQGLKFTALYNHGHVLLRANAGGKAIDIECTTPFGFGTDTEKSKEASHKNLKEGGILTLASQAYNERGAEKHKAGNFEDAIAEYDKAVAIMPDYALGYSNRGAAKGRLGKFEDAIADYNKAIEIMPEFADTYHNRGVARYKMGDLKGAEEDFQMSDILMAKQEYE